MQVALDWTGGIKNIEVDRKQMRRGLATFRYLGHAALI